MGMNLKPPAGSAGKAVPGWNGKLLPLQYHRLLIFYWKIIPMILNCLIGHFKHSKSVCSISTICFQCACIILIDQSRTLQHIYPEYNYILEQVHEKDLRRWFSQSVMYLLTWHCQLVNLIGVTMVSVVALSAINRGFKALLGKTKEYKISIFCFSTM